MYRWVTSERRGFEAQPLYSFNPMYNHSLYNMGMRFHSHACIFTYTCSWSISTYCMQTHEKSIFLMHARCSSPIPPSKNGFYEFWVYMVKGDHNTSYYYFFLTQMPKYHKVSFLSSACSILYQNSFPLMETTPISLWVHLHCTTLHWTRKVWWSASNLRQSL